MEALKMSLMVGALENARFGVCVVDASARIVFLNKAFSIKIGIPAEHVLGQSYLSLFSRFGKSNEFHDIFSPQKPDISVECALTLNDGLQRYLLMQSSTLAHESGEMFRIISAMDITDYGVTRDRFVELRQQMDAMNNSVVISDARAPDMPITYVNAHFERMTGYSAAEVVGRNCRFLQGDDRDQAAREKLRNAIEKRESCHVSPKNYRKDGTAFINELYISPVYDAAGALTHFIGVQHEATGRVLPERLSA